MCKFYVIKAILTSSEKVICTCLALVRLKLKSHKLSSCFNVCGYKKPFRKDNDSYGGASIIVYLRNIIKDKRRF